LKEAVAPPPRAIPVPNFHTLLGPESGAVALAEWNRIVPILQRMGSASAIDAYLLREYCVCFARTEACEEQLSREGLLIDGQREGTKVRHPLTTVSNTYRTASKAICAQLGIGANVRGQMNLTPPKAPNGAGTTGWLPEKVD
jgi:P27 family predicted phage terminase small subunit